MDHAAVVRQGEALRHLQQDARGLEGLQPVLALEPLAERLAFDELHREIGLALVLADQVDLHDVRIVELRHAARLAEEAFDHQGVVGQCLRQHLDRHMSLQRGLEALVDHAHATAPEFGDDVVMTNLAALCHGGSDLRG